MVVSAIITITWISLVLWLNLTRGIHLLLVVYAGFLPCWIMFFVLGVALGQQTNRDYRIIIPLMITSAGLVLSVIGANYLYNHYSTGVGIKASAFIYSFGVILLLFSSNAENFISKGGAIFKATTFIGELSFGIYLTHCYVLTFVSRLQIASWFIRFILTIGITIVFIIKLRKMIPTRFHKYFGI